VRGLGGPPSHSAMLGSPLWGVALGSVGVCRWAQHHPRSTVKDRHQRRGGARRGDQTRSPLPLALAGRGVAVSRCVTVGPVDR